MQFFTKKLCYTVEQWRWWIIYCNKKKFGKKKNSLAAQWLAFHTFSEGAQVWSLVMELGSHKPQSTAKNKIKNKLKKKGI